MREMMMMMRRRMREMMRVELQQLSMKPQSAATMLLQEYQRLH